MYIGSLLNNKLNKNYTYSYFQRGMKENYNPDFIKEETERKVYTKENGYLFVKRNVAWEETKLLSSGVDIKFDFFETLFVDYVYIKQGLNSQIGSVELFTEIDSEYKKIGKYLPETGKNIATEEFKVSATEYVDNLIIRLNGNSVTVNIEELDIFGGINLSDSVWPIPLKYDCDGKTYPLSMLNSISYSNDDELFAANYFIERFSEITSETLCAVEGEADIVLKLLPECDKDRYFLKSENGKCVVEGTGRRGLMYGLSALIQLIDKDVVKNATLENEDFMQIRGAHFALPDKNSVDFIKNMVKYVFIPNHYNMIFVEIAGAMKYDSYPEISQKWQEVCEKYEKGELPTPAHYGFVSRDIWEKNEVKEFFGFMEEYGLEVVPEIQTWGHTQYITCAFPHLAEIPVDIEEDSAVNLRNLDENAKRSDVYYHTMCPNHPDYYKVTFNIIDEIIDLLKPKRYIHLGHDEVYNVSECKRCKDIPKTEIVVKEITTLRDYIASKNLTMMIWGDMLQKMPYSTPNAALSVPKDIIMLDFVWYFDMDKDIEDHLLNNGYQVVMGNMYSSHYTRYASRCKKEGMIGAQVSTWIRGCNEETYGFEGKMFDFIYSSTSICNPSYNPDYRFTYYELVKPVIKNTRMLIGGLNINKEERVIELKGKENNIPYDIRGIVPYNKALSVSINNPLEEIKINDTFEVISFTHATDIFAHKIMWKPAFVVGELEIRYSDNSSYTKQIVFGKNVYKYLAPFGDIMKSQFFRHQGYIGTYNLIPECGKTYDGDSFTLGNYSIKNPYPEKKVESITLKHNKTTGVKWIVFDVKIK